MFSVVFSYYPDVEIETVTDDDDRFVTAFTLFAMRPTAARVVPQRNV